MVHSFELRLTGQAAQGARLEAGLLRDLLNVLVTGAQGALRLRVEGRSRATGPDPAWLAAAARVDVVGLSEGSTTIALESPAICDAAPQRFAQGELFHDFDRSSSAIHLFVESLREAMRARADSELYDQTLLRTFASLSSVFEAGLAAVEIRNCREAAATAVTADRLAGVTRLIRDTPPSQRVRLAGQLDTIRHSDRMFVLVLDDGTTIKGVAEAAAPRQLADQFGKPVVITGLAVFRPSGRVLRVEADSVEPAGNQELTVWSRQPRPSFGRLEERSLIQPQGPRSGLNALIGQWPGDETDEQFLAAVAELS